MELNVKLQVFEGPLDLLLYLLEKNKVNIYDIPISDITRQYLEYMKLLDQQDLDTASEFLVMAATLLSIKSRMLLPSEQTKEDEEEDPRAELVRQLLEYKTYKLMAQELKDRQIDAQKCFYKKPSLPQEVVSYIPPVDLSELTQGITLSRLNQVFQGILKKQNEKIDPIRSKFGRIEKEKISVEDRMVFIIDRTRREKKFSFTALFEGQSTRTEIVITFLAVLELIKNGRIRITQEHLFDEIFIERDGGEEV